MSYIICTDSIIDAPESFFTENNIKIIEHGMVIDNKEIYDGFGKIVPFPDIYKKLRNGEKISTILGNVDQMHEHFSDALANNQDILYISFPSALSGTFDTANIIADDVRAIMPESTGRIFVIDGKCVGAGQGILIRNILEKKNLGISIENLIELIKEERNYIHHYAVIDNLDHLKRGGRISKASAFVGTLIGVKPILYVTSNGELVPFSKARGMTASFKVFIDKINENYINGGEIFVSHADNLKSALELKEMILKETQAKIVNIAYIGNTIGCHVGPGAVGVFFKGKSH